MVRRLALMFMAAIVLAMSWWRTPPAQIVRIEAPALVPLVLATDRFGPFRLTGAWQITGRGPAYGGYSALLPAPGGGLLAFGDYGNRLDLPPPEARQPPRAGVLDPGSMRRKRWNDLEAAAGDPATGALWLAREGSNDFLVYGAQGARRVAAPAMAEWGGNSGPEAMTRLPDGRFVAICECRASWLGTAPHPALLYPSTPDSGMPPQRFALATQPGYRPTDMAVLPDGRLLVLLRRLVWPMPAAFDSLLLLVDPGRIVAGQTLAGKVIARIDGTFAENYEGMAIVPQPGGPPTLWLISDDNRAVTQRTLLLQLRFDPAAL